MIATRKGDRNLSSQNIDREESTTDATKTMIEAEAHVVDESDDSVDMRNNVHRSVWSQRISGDTEAPNREDNNAHGSTLRERDSRMTTAVCTGNKESRRQ